MMLFTHWGCFVLFCLDSPIHWPGSGSWVFSSTSHCARHYGFGSRTSPGLSLPAWWRDVENRRAITADCDVLLWWSAEYCGDTVAETLTFYVSVFVFVCANVFTWFWFCFVCRIFRSAQHKCVCLGPQQQLDGSGALYETGFSAAKTSSQNTLTEARVDLMAWELFCTLKASKTVQTFVSSRHQTREEKHHEMAWTFVHLNFQELLWPLVGRGGYAEAEGRRLASEMILPFLTKGQKCSVDSVGVWVV